MNTYAYVYTRTYITTVYVYIRIYMYGDWF